MTEARAGRDVEVRRRQWRYFLTMLFRTACLLLATFLPIAGVFRGLLVAAAVFLPFFAVVGANAPPPKQATPEAMRDARDRHALPPGSGPTIDAEDVA